MKALFSVLILLATSAHAAQENSIQVEKVFDGLAMECTSENLGEFALKVKAVTSNFQDATNKADVTLQLYTCIKNDTQFELKAISPSDKTIRRSVDASGRLIHIERHLENLITVIANNDFSFVQESKSTTNTDGTFTGKFSVPQNQKEVFVFVKAKLVYRVQETNFEDFDFTHFGSFRIKF